MKNKINKRQQNNKIRAIKNKNRNRKNLKDQKTKHKSVNMVSRSEDRQVDRQVNRQVDRQTGRHTDSWGSCFHGFVFVASCFILKVSCAASSLLLFPPVLIVGPALISPTCLPGVFKSVLLLCLSVFCFDFLLLNVLTGVWIYGWCHFGFSCHFGLISGFDLSCLDIQ